MVRTYKTMISIFKVRFKCDDDLLAEIAHLGLKVFYILALLFNFLDEQTP
jgi:hypothetical protein